jgi:hypothetical protein
MIVGLNDKISGLIRRERMRERGEDTARKALSIIREESLFRNKLQTGQHLILITDFPASKNKCQ